jgi:hypothetical protein
MFSPAMPGHRFQNSVLHERTPKSSTLLYIVQRDILSAIFGALTIELFPRSNLRKFPMARSPEFFIGFMPWDGLSFVDSA